MADTEKILRRRLAEMHTYARPHGTSVDNDFRRVFLGDFKPTRDPFGNLHVQIGDDSKILFSCHTDTVSRFAGRQGVYIDGMDRLRLTRRARRQAGACLGADDTVGVFLMSEMIRAGVPGYYIFHYGEEAGCIGSRSLAKHRAEWLARFDAAIAFDRKDVGDIITHQCGWRTASNDFADALAGGLNRAIPGFKYAASDRGLYTDTNSYSEIIAECTNVSIGYEGAHGADESVDVGHVLRLREALLAVDWPGLPIARDPEEDEDAYEWETYTTPVATAGGPRLISKAKTLWSQARSVVSPLWGSSPTVCTCGPVVMSGHVLHADDCPIYDDGKSECTCGWHDGDDTGHESWCELADEETGRDLPPDPYRRLHDVIFLCEACGLEYFVAESEAVHKTAFCSPECEHFTGNRR